MAKEAPRLPIQTLVVHEAAKTIKSIFPAIIRLHLVGSRLRHRYGRDLDFVAVTRNSLLAGRNKTVKIGNLSINLFISEPSNVEAAIIEYGLGLDIKRWKKAAKDRGLKLNRYGLWRGNILVTSKMGKIAEILGMRLKSSLILSLKNPL